jgi:hypothetical protein
MNFKVMLGFGLLAMSAAMAQDETAAVAAPVVAPVTAAPAPAAKATTASAGVFDGVRGSAFNSVGNEAAPSTIDDYLARPNNFGGAQMLYIEPAAERGLVSFGTDRTFFAQFDNSEDLGRLTLGMANKGGWGLDVRLALGQYHVSSDGGSAGLTSAGDDWGATFATPLGGYVLALSADWLTNADEMNTDVDNEKKTSENYSDFTVNVNLNNGPSAGAATWTLGADFDRHLNYTKNGGTTDDSGALSYTKFSPYFNIGGQALGNEKAHVFIGANSSLPIVVFDGYDSTASGTKVDEGLFEIGIVVEPNIIGEIAVTDNFLVYGEASYNWLVFGYANGTDADGIDYDVLESHSNAATATAGIRYQKDNRYAVEFALGDEVFTSTHAIFNGNNTFVSFGGFLYF